jgi:hypothetical protein
MKQKSLNKIMVVAILCLSFVVLLLRFTEQKRVEYYICYEQVSSSITSMTREEVQERCEIRLNERND